jgi:hypothetical protein
VLDPTLLVDKTHYIASFINQSIENKKDQLLTYILDEDKNKKEIIAEISKAKKWLRLITNPKKV